MEQMNADGLDTLNIDYEEGRWPESARTFRPLVYRDGESYCCLLGPDPQEGVFGCGDNVEDAVMDWDEQLQKRIQQRNMADPVTQYVVDTNNTTKTDFG